MSRIAFSVTSLLAVAALAACSDSPIGPSSSAKPAPSDTKPALASGVVPKRGMVIATVQVGALNMPAAFGVPGTTVEFVTNNGGNLVITDNAPGDLDQRVGYYSVLMPVATQYTAYLISAADEFSLIGGVGYGTAFTTPTLMPIGKITVPKKSTLDIALTYKLGFAISQTIKVTGSVTNDFSATITDGGPSDKNYDGTQNPADGKFHLRLPTSGPYLVCAMTTPEPLWGADCVTVAAPWVNPAYSAVLTYKQQWYLPKF